MPIAKVAAFHNHEQLTGELRKIEEAGRGLVKITSIGKSLEGRDIWCAEAANRKNKTPLQYRPALLMMGNMHGSEIAGSCQALHFLSYLIEHYATDNVVRRLLDEQVVFVIPRIAVDAADYIIATSRLVRSRHIDVREPNVSYPQDLNGDGKILQMRWTNKAGAYQMSKKDPRILLPREPDNTDGPFYEMTGEGLIHAWDGGKVLDSQARCDFCRNFPSATWQPMPNLIGQGPYPLSEPETRAMADFVLAHPNITVAADFHTGNPAVFYPVQTIKDGARHTADAELIERIGKRAEKITGWPFLSSYVEVKDGIKRNECPGTCWSWLYERTGALSYAFEMGMFYNYCGFTTFDYFKLSDHTEKTSMALLAAHDADPEIGLFVDWQPFDHPQLGRVEIGGWNYLPWGNPPLKKEMEGACAKGTQFLLEYAQWRPQVMITSLAAESLSANLFHLKLQLVNMGNLPTYLTEQGKEMCLRMEPTVELGGKGNITCVTGKMTQQIEHLAANGGSKQLEWVLRGEPGTTVTVTVHSPQGVYASSQVEL